MIYQVSLRLQTLLLPLLSPAFPPHMHTHLLCASVIPTLHSYSQSHHPLSFLGLYPETHCSLCLQHFGPLSPSLHLKDFYLSFMSQCRHCVLWETSSFLPLHSRLNNGHPKITCPKPSNFLFWKKGLYRCN